MVKIYLEHSIIIGLNQESTLSRFLYAIVIDKLTRSIQDKIPWYMLFMDDIILVEETRASVNAMLEI